MFTICPDCANEKIKVKITEKREYDPATTRVTVHEEIPMAEYHCHACGWTVLVEDPGDIPESMLHKPEAGEKVTGNTRGE